MTVAIENLYLAAFNLCDLGASVLSFEQTDGLNTQRGISQQLKGRTAYSWNDWLGQNLSLFHDGFSKPGLLSAWS